MKANNSLFRSAMKGKWIEVEKIYKEDRKSHEAKITKLGDTALHVAVSDGQVEIVKKLVDIISSVDGGSERVKKALNVKNERGNTPLHLAAALDNVEMCKCIAEKDPDLIIVRNQEQKTPLFLAALHGKKDAFLCLDNIWRSKPMKDDYSICIGNQGETLLHAAITGEYFDLAFQIICRYGDLANFINEKGLTPLHVLATKPSFFKSGSRLAGFDKIIYHCTFVDDLKEEKPDEEKKKKKEKKKRKSPENYQTCINIFLLFWNLVCVICNFTKNKNTPNQDTESQVTKNKNTPNQDTESQVTKNKNTPNQDTESQAQERHPMLPPNYQVCFEAVKVISKAMLIILGIGSREIKKVQDKKQQHVWSLQILSKLLHLSKQYEYEYNGQNPGTIKNSSEASENNQKKENGEKEKSTTDQDVDKNESALLIAAKYGIMEIVEQILELFPVAIHDMNTDGKNIVLLAVENRQTHIYQFLLRRDAKKENIFNIVDKDGNSVMHLAAKVGEDRPWLIPGGALQMQWEIKWFEFIKHSMPISFWTRYNNKHQTPDEMFIKNYDDLVKDDIRWLMKTSESCTIAATLIATVAFATSASIPGGFDQNHGEPVLKQQGMFDVFSISSLAALCFSITALILFIAILTTQHQAMDFRRKLPWMLLIGLSTLFLSIASMLVSFCGGHFFILKGVLRDAWLVEYLMVLLPMAIFVRVQFPLYFNLFRAAIKKVPEHRYVTNTF